MADMNENEVRRIVRDELADEHERIAEKMEQDGVYGPMAISQHRQRAAELRAAADQAPQERRFPSGTRFSRADMDWEAIVWHSRSGLWQTYIPGCGTRVIEGPTLEEIFGRNAYLWTPIEESEASNGD